MGHHAVNAELCGKDLVVEKPHIFASRRANRR